jgi:hypothetical protein
MEAIMTEIKDKKRYFVILWQEELKMKATPAEKIVYAAIKSFTSNGRQPQDLSLRDIQRRSGVSYKHVSRSIQGLIDKKRIEKIGKKTRKGGIVDIYKVCLDDTVKNIKRVIRTQLKEESVSSCPESVSSVPIGSKVKKATTIQSETESNKVNNKYNKLLRSKNYLLQVPLFDLQSFSNSYRVTEAEVEQKAEELFHYCEAKGKAYKNYRSLLIKALIKQYGNRNTGYSQAGYKVVR